jgi:predicted nucleic acid-binding protein
MTAASNTPTITNLAAIGEFDLLQKCYVAGYIAN